MSITIKLSHDQYNELRSELVSLREINHDVLDCKIKDSCDRTYETNRQAMLKDLQAAVGKNFLWEEELAVIKQYLSKLKVIELDSDEDACIMYGILRKI